MLESPAPCIESLELFVEVNKEFQIEYEVGEVVVVFCPHLLLFVLEGFAFQSSFPFRGIGTVRGGAQIVGSIQL